MTGLCQDFHGVLGNTFLTGSKAVLHFEHHTVLLTRDCKLYQLKATNSAAESDRDAVFDEFHDARQFLNCAQG